MEKSTRRVGTVSRGIRCPIIRQGDDLASIVTDSVLLAAKEEGFDLRDRDVVSITESIVARAQGNYASVQDIAADVRAKCGGGTVGVIFPPRGTTLPCRISLRTCAPSAAAEPWVSFSPF